MLRAGVQWFNAEDAEGEEEDGRKAEEGAHAEDQSTGERQEKEEGNMDRQDGRDEGGETGEVKEERQKRKGRGEGRLVRGHGGGCARSAQATSCEWGVWGRGLCFTGPGASASGSNGAGLCGEEAPSRTAQPSPEELARVVARGEAEEGNRDGRDAQDEGGDASVGVRAGARGRWMWLREVDCEHGGCCALRAQAPSCEWGVWGRGLCFTGPGASASGFNGARRGSVGHG